MTILSRECPTSDAPEHAQKGYFDTKDGFSEYSQPRSNEAVLAALPGCCPLPLLRLSPGAWLRLR